MDTQIFFWLSCQPISLTPAKQLLLLDEEHIQVRALVKGDVLDEGDVVDARRLLQSREAQPVIKVQ